MGRRPASGAPSKRRWLRYGIIVGILLLAVVVYETGQQLRRGGAGDERQASAPDAPRAGDAAPAAADSVPRIARYYRSHDLPAGWTVGASARSGAGTVEVALHFAPGIRSSRHGEAARAGEIGPHNACPTLESGLWSTLAEAAFEIVVSDKTGAIDRFACTAPAPAD